MVDYSKWKTIEISDDEDDVHPNIDTPSLFRWRHQARMARMQEQQRERERVEREKKQVLQKKEILEMKMKEAAEKTLPSTKDLEEELHVIQKDEERFRRLEAELAKKEKLTPWNVDTICREGFSKTVVNVRAKQGDENLTEEERERRMNEFYDEHEKEIMEYSLLQKYEDMKKYLQEHQHLVCEDTANYLVVHCINLAMEEKWDMMDHVACQIICMQFIMEFVKHFDPDLRACITSVYDKIQIADEQYQAAFNMELNAFKGRVKKRAEEKVQAAIEKYEEEERQKRLGPGGLDPVEVFESLPPALQQCFKSKDIELLKKTISELPEEEARNHMERCINAGMWIPPKDDSAEKEEEGAPATS